MTVKSSISLTDWQHSFAKELVQTQRYSSVSVVLQQGIDLLRQHMQDDLQRTALKALLHQCAAGAFVGGAQMDKSIARIITEKRRHMRFGIELSAEAERDFSLIFDHLFGSYRSFGENVKAALDDCENRIRSFRQEADRLGAAQFRGESHYSLGPGLRHLTINPAVHWFEVN
jgi:Arc/MetJ-type ribon-helix-helix transcriptional regulator/plasmid stabilization system protein ParE